MDCCNCCTSTLNLGCYSPCVTALDLTAVVGIGDAGTWRLEFDFGRLVIAFESVFAEGDPIIFRLTDLNEFYTYNGLIRKPDGTVLNFTVAAVIYDCLQLTTKIGASDTIIINATI